MTTDNLNCYGTTAEKAFLKRIADSKNATDLLSNYLTAADKRVVWGTIDRTEVTEYARILLGNAAAATRTAQTTARAA